MTRRLLDETSDPPLQQTDDTAEGAVSSAGAAETNLRNRKEQSALTARKAETTAKTAADAQKRLKTRRYQQLYADWLRLVLDKKFGTGWSVVFGSHVGYAVKYRKGSLGMFMIDKYVLLLYKVGEGFLVYVVAM